GLVNFIKQNTPATFWVRFLSHLVDLCLWPFANILVVKEPKAVFVALFINAVVFLTWFFVPALLPFVSPLWVLYMYWMYFAVSESTTMRTTIGKDGFGLIVNDMNDKQLTLQTATKRVFGRYLCMLLGFFPYLLAATPQK